MGRNSVYIILIQIFIYSRFILLAGLLTTITLLVLQKAQPQGPLMEDEVSTQSKYMPASQKYEIKFSRFFHNLNIDIEIISF